MMPIYIGAAMLAYAQGSGDWNAVKTAFVDGCAVEYAKANASPSA